MGKILVGSGFYSTEADHSRKLKFFENWSMNTARVSPQLIAVVDNSQCGLPEHCGVEVVRVRNNLGRSDNHALRGSKLMGWSISWILPALIAYSEGMDFVYKEQDCLAFGDWLPQITLGAMSVGKHPSMPCEQSLFWMARWFIPEFVAAYLAHADPDNQTVTEDKMIQCANGFGHLVQFFDMPFGRARPLTYFKDRPWYAQRFTGQELIELELAGFFD